MAFTTLTYRVRFVTPAFRGNADKGRGDAVRPKR